LRDQYQLPSQYRETPYVININIKEDKKPILTDLTKLDLTTSPPMRIKDTMTNLKVDSTWFADSNDVLLDRQPVILNVISLTTTGKDTQWITISRSGQDILMSGTPPLNNDYAGTYKLLVEATDPRGGPSNTYEFKFYLDKNRKP